MPGWSIRARAPRGEPREAALEAIDELEDLDRGWYAGPVGWMDAAEDGEMCVALRSALLRDRTAHLYAGGGIVADSVPADELAETEVKLDALLRAHVDPECRRKRPDRADRGRQNKESQAARPIRFVHDAPVCPARLHYRAAESTISLAGTPLMNFAVRAVRAASFHCFAA